MKKITQRKERKGVFEDHPGPGVYPARTEPVEQPPRQNESP